jgi:hypothetical protein
MLRSRIEPALAPILSGTPQEGRADESWYWAAPIVLDLEYAPHATQAWLGRDDLAIRWEGLDEASAPETEPTAWAAHVEQAQSMLDGWRPEGPPPDDLVEVLIDLALAGPGTAALRSLNRVLGVSSSADNGVAVRDHAAQFAWGFRKLFNQPEAMALIRGLRDDYPYWRLVLMYAVDGGLQAVLDEYVHLLRESRGVADFEIDRAATEIVAAARGVLSMITSRSEWDEIRCEGLDPQTQLPRRSLRTHFALRFGTEELDDGSGRTREEQVRDAFNSPFWPFVVVSTSVGQEGLDFHSYCHAVIHWNLPPNPVDLEQREGRIHRYKNHAVRKNVASNAPIAQANTSDDPWAALFAWVENEHGAHARGLVPYWNFPVPNGARIERHVPTLPLSRDRQKLNALRRSLAVYRMVFGQARQEDLVEYLLEHLPEEQIDELSQALQIRLAPPTYG